MKKIILGFILLTSLMARADIDQGAIKSTEPKAEEISASRSCFNELEMLGCGHPREDIKQFRSCMENVFSTLTPACQKLMSGLYIKRN